MEITDTQRRFEKLVDELERLRSATDQIDQSASTTAELASQVSDVVETVDALIPQIQSAVDESIQGIESEAIELRSAAEKLKQFQQTVQSRHDDQLKDLRSAIDESLEETSAAHDQKLEDLSEDVRALIYRARKSLEDTAEQLEEKVEGDLEAHSDRMSQEISEGIGEIRKHVRQLREDNEEQRRRVEDLSDKIETYRWNVLTLAGVGGLVLVVVVILVLLG